MFEKIKAPEVCASNKPIQLAIQYMEKRVRDEGEPYDQQVAEGKHLEHEQDLLKVISEAREIQNKEASKKKAKSLARWKKRVQQSNSSGGEEGHHPSQPGESSSQDAQAQARGSGSQETRLN